MVSVPYAVAFAAATVLSVIVTWRAIQAKPRTGAGWFAVAMGGVAWWSLMKFHEVLVDDFERIELFFNALHWIGVGAVSIGVLGFGLSLRGRDELLSPSRIVLLSVIPALTVLTWLGDPRVVALLASGATLHPVVVWGLDTLDSAWSWFRWVSLLYLWGLVAIGSLFILETALERPKLDPSRFSLGVMVAVPWLVNLLYEVGVISAPFDPTVLAFVVTGVAGIATIDRFRLFDVPFARSRIVEQFSTPILVYGHDGRLYDYNERATDVLGIGPGDLDEDVRTVLADTPLALPGPSAENGRSLAESLDGTRVSIPSDGTDPHHFLVQVSPLGTDDAGELGNTIQLTDITERFQQREQIRNERDLRELIRSLLVELSSRETIEQALCDQLVEDDRYSSAWISESLSNGEFAVRTSASAAGFDIGFDRHEPGRRITELGVDALETGDVSVCPDLVSAEADTVADRLVENGVHQVAVVPLTYNDLSYGILGVCTTRSDALEPEERQLLVDLGESIAFAINAIEQREALYGEQIRELSLRIRDPEHYLVSLATALSSQDGNKTITAYEINDLLPSSSGSSPVPETDDHVLHFLTVRGVPAESVVDHLDAHRDIQSVTILKDSGEVVSLRLLVRPPSVGSLLTDVGGVVRTIRVVDGTVQVVAEFSPRTDINHVIDHVRDVYPQTSVQSLVMKTPAEALQVSSPLAALTAKQRRAVDAAYRCGFFERPQGQTADEIATALDISRSTFLKHLRQAEHTLLAELLPTAESEHVPEDDG